MRVVAWAAAFVLAACASPAARVEQRAADYGFMRSVVAGAPFRHLLYDRPDERHTTLHVYIEHDGTPWLDGTRVAADPTPRAPLMLDLMALDRGAVLYLGRPCYFALDGPPLCPPLMWTHRRYAAEVVDSMAAALGRFLAGRPAERIAFFGHSGGGTLAVLLAERFPQTVAVVTLGANLDVDAWARLHDYTPLAGSLNPAIRPPLPPSVVQRHYVGTRDRVVPPALVRAYAATHDGAQVIEVTDIDHACCWRERWPAILADLDGRQAAR